MSEIRGYPCRIFLHLTPCRIYRVAHLSIHRPKLREVDGIRQVFSTEDDIHDILGKVRNRLLRVELVRIRHSSALCILRSSARSFIRTLGRSHVVVLHVVARGARSAEGRFNQSQFPRTLRLELIFAFDRPASHSIPSPLSAVTQATRACAPVRPARHAHAHDRPGDPSGHRGPCVEYIQAETRQDAEGDREDTGCEGTRRRRLREVEVEIDRWRIGVEDHLHGPHNTQRCLHEKTQILVVLPHHRGRAVRPEGA